MSTTLKFRAWDKIIRQFAYSDEFDFKDNNEKLKYFFEKCAALKYKVINRFTGMTDKNGKEIYEGDIMRIPGDWKRFCVGGVIFREASFQIKVHNRQGNLYHDLINGDDDYRYINLGGDNIMWRPRREIGIGIEIVGNICKNPELLK